MDFMSADQKSQNSSTLGKPFNLPRPEQIKQPDANTLGFGWELSKEARRDLEEIERVTIRG